MKASLWIALAALSFPALPVAAQTASNSSYSTPSSRAIRCGTESSRRALCAAGAEVASARLVRDLSSGKCGSAGSWGWTSNAVWADNGCRGDFRVTYRTASDPVTRRIGCGTLRSRRDECSAKGVVDSAWLVKRSFFSDCRQGSNWGYRDTLIWAGNGCRGEFEVRYRRAAPGPRPEPAKPVTHTRDSLPAGGTKRITCGSASAVQVQCSTGGPASGVQVVRNMGSRQCREGDNWKHTGATILAGNGCRAEFEVTYGRNGTSGMRPMAPSTRIISCGNASGSAMSCNAFGTVATVRLQHDRSGGRCGRFASWGLGEQSIWVTQGCFGDFELSYTG